jgi:Fur family transcriptional regulator, iron response regulator
MEDSIALLRKHGIQATPQRIAVAECVLGIVGHPTADQVWALVKRRQPTVSRATIYNTLNLFVEKHLLKTQVLTGGTVIYDPSVKPHHHFIDQATGAVYDIPWDAVRVSGGESLPGFEVEEYQVILRGRRRAEAG